MQKGILVYNKLSAVYPSGEYFKISFPNHASSKYKLGHPV